jgi:hypothetical protein
MLREACGPGRRKFLVESEFRKNYVKVYESAQQGKENYTIMKNGKFAICIIQADILNTITELSDYFQSQMEKSTPVD